MDNQDWWRYVVLTVFADNVALSVVIMDMKKSIRQKSKCFLEHLACVRHKM